MQPGKLSFWIKLVYGSGEWSYASFGTLRQIFYAIFLTDVVGLDARLAFGSPAVSTVPAPDGDAGARRDCRQVPA